MSKVPGHFFELRTSVVDGVPGRGDPGGDIVRLASVVVLTIWADTGYKLETPVEP